MTARRNSPRIDPMLAQNALAAVVSNVIGQGIQSTRSLSLSLPWPPSMNTYWRHIVMGKRVATILSEEARDYRVAVAQQILVQRVPRSSLTGKLAVEITVFPPDRRDRDIDNLPKGILDSLKHANVIRDDADIDDLHIVRGPLRKNAGQVQVIIREIAGAATVSGDLFPGEVA